MDIKKEKPKKSFAGKYGRGAKVFKQHALIGSIVMPIEELQERLLDFHDPRKGRKWAAKRTKAFNGIVNRIADGEELDDEKLQADPCYEYFRELHKTHSPQYKHKRSMQLMREWKTLYEDIRDNGLRNPIDVWRYQDDLQGLCIVRGWRRLTIIFALHNRGIHLFPKIPIRLFKNIHIFRKYNPGKRIGGEKNSIHNIAQKQFMEKVQNATDKYWVHSYTRHYDRHFAPLRNKPVKLLEIGVYKGASLLLWKDVFPKGEIFGLDKNTAVWQKYLAGQDRIKVFVGHQEDEKFLKEQVIAGGPYDIIIDDGSHIPSQQLATFKNLWPALDKGGMYVIEDIHNNYWTSKTKEKPFMINEVKNIFDKINDSIEKGSEFFSMTTYYNIVFIEKIR